MFDRFVADLTGLRRSIACLLIFALSACSVVQETAQDSTPTTSTNLTSVGRNNSGIPKTLTGGKNIDSNSTAQKPVLLLESAIGDFEWPDYPDEDSVNFWIDQYLDKPEQFEAILARGEPYLYYILSQLKIRQMPSELAFLPFVESGFQPNADSSSGAAGLWQFMPATGRALSLNQDWWVDERRSIDRSTNAALDYLNYLYDNFDHDWFLALAAYNTGEGNLHKILQNSGDGSTFWTLKLNSETASFVPKLLAVVYILKHADELNFALPAWPNEAYFEIYQSDRQLNLQTLASALGVESLALLSMNAHYPQKITSPNQIAYLAIPTGMTLQAESAIASMPALTTPNWDHYQVRSGDNLSLIADRMGVTVRALLEVNQLASNLIHPGDDLLIPISARAKPETTPAPRAGTAMVKEGDSPWLIARRYSVSLDSLLRANGLKGTDLIHPGQILKLPGQSSGDLQIIHQVKLGDSLYDIATHYGVGLGELKRWNSLGNSNLIRPGDQLTIWLGSDS